MLSTARQIWRFYQTDILNTMNLVNISTLYSKGKIIKHERIPRNHFHRSFLADNYPMNNTYELTLYAA